MIQGVYCHEHGCPRASEPDLKDDVGQGDYVDWLDDGLERNPRGDN